MGKVSTRVPDHLGPATELQGTLRLLAVLAHGAEALAGLCEAETSGEVEEG